ncbi:hypothetical protein SLA2020_234910 [Shorea laevis]
MCSGGLIPISQVFYLIKEMMFMQLPSNFPSVCDVVFVLVIVDIFVELSLATLLGSHCFKVSCSSSQGNPSSSQRLCWLRVIPISGELYVMFLSSVFLCDVFICVALVLPVYFLCTGLLSFA